MNEIVPIGKDLTEFTWGEDQLTLLKNTVAKGQDLSDNEFLLMGYVAKQAGLDPFLRQLYPIKFQDKNGKKILNFITSIDGYRLIAERTGKYAGRDDYMYNEGLSLYQMLNDKQEDGKKITLQTATATVYKMVEGVRCPTCSTIRWKEFYPASKFKQFMWNRMPFLMLGKVAEAQSLRAAFPNNYKGIYLDAEFDQSEADPAYMPEDTEDLIQEVVGLYGMLGYNEAKQIQINMKYVGKTSLHIAHKEQLEMLIYHLKEEVEKVNGDH